MGNRQGQQKESKSKEDKKREKEARREKEKRKKRNEKQKKRKFSGQCGHGLDSDMDGSSLVTGADSVSSVFHSAENVSTSPYLDSTTRSELDQIRPENAPYPHSRWGPPSSVSAYQIHNHQFSRHHDPHHRHHPQHQPPEPQHPMVLSSKDFKDGFSLEAFIPSDIARTETSTYMEETPRCPISRGDTSGNNGSVKSRRSNKSAGSVKSKSSKSSFKTPGSSHHATPVSLRAQADDSASMTSSHTSTGGGTAGYSTPLLSTPVFGRIDRCSISPLSSTSSCLPRVQESDRGDTSPKIQAKSKKDSSSCASPDSNSHHPHFFNHQRSNKQHPNQQPNPHAQSMQQQLQQKQFQQNTNPQKMSISAQNAEIKRRFLETFTSQPPEMMPQQENQQTFKENQQNLHPFRQHFPDYNNLPKPTSPYPQRRAFSPKMASTSFKLISSDDSSSSPTTPVPQRRAANFLEFLRPGSKRDKCNTKPLANTGSGNDSEEGVSTPKRENGDSSPNLNKDEKSKIKPKWKTWERSKSKKSGDKQSKISMIFGTVRKNDKNKRQSSGGNTADEKDKESDLIFQSQRMNNENNTNHQNQFSSDIDNKTVSTTCTNIISQSSKNSSKGSNSNGSGSSKRNSSPPLVRSAAFCIMKLEELERNIENTIREKFPDAEPFLLKQRSKEEELKGSRSLPTTPSLKKKMYASKESDSKRHSEIHDNVVSDLNTASTKLSEVTSQSVNGSKATYESLPSPAMSPVVLRRFGARTRHASISPKIQRAKTAALYNSPREMDRVDEVQAPSCMTPTKASVSQATISKEPKYPFLSSNLASPLRNNLKSQSRYDNVNNESNEDVKQTKINEQVSAYEHIQETNVDEDDSDEIDESTSLGYGTSCDTEYEKPVIVPTFSAVFGSVSPKLRRHLAQKIKDSSKGNETSVKSGSLTNNDNSIVHKDKPCVSTNSKNDGYIGENSVCVEEAFRASETTKFGEMPKTESDKKKISVKERIKTLNKSASVGWSSASDARNHKAAIQHDIKSSQNKTHIVERSPGKLISPFRERTSNSESDHTSFAFPGSPSSGSFSCPSSPPTAMRSPDFVTCKITGYSPVSQRKHSRERAVFGSPVSPHCRRVSQPMTSHGTKETHISGPTSSVNKSTNSENNKLIDSSSKASDHIDIGPCESKSVAVPVFKDKINTSGKGILETNLDLDIDTQTTAPGHAQNQIDAEYNDDSFKRQPLSKLIFNIISGSQPEQRLEQMPLDENKMSTYQSNLKDTTEKNVEEEVTAAVTSCTYIQPFILEEQNVYGESRGTSSSENEALNKNERSSSENNLSNTSDNKISRSAGSQTETFSTADKGVESDDLAMFSFSFDKSLSLSPQSEHKSTKHKNLGVGTSSNFDDTSEDDVFIQKVMTFQRTDCPRKEENSVKVTEDQVDDTFTPPPPSPSAMEKLLEEFEEEEEDDDAQERKDIESAMQRESEIQTFTDKIFKRLSDLLGSQSGDAEDADADDDVFENEEQGDIRKRSVGDLLSRLESKSSASDSSGEDFSEKERKGLADRVAAKAIVASKESPSTNRVKKVLHIRSSSSSITTTSSSSEDEEVVEKLALTSLMLQKPGQPQTHDDDKSEDNEGSLRFKEHLSHFVFPELTARQITDNSKRYSSSRECHSDDDVARGQGIPDYYDDKPLWQRRQKPPSQLSLDTIAIKRQERRDRWLKKRRRNRTDLLSTGGSSDTGSERCLVSLHPRLVNQTARIHSEDAEPVSPTAIEPKEAMGSGILTSPKYAKPILPFLNQIKASSNKSPVESRVEVQEDIIKAKIANERLQASFQYLRNEEDCDKELPGRSIQRRDSLDRNVFSDDNYDDRYRVGEPVSGSGKDRDKVTSDCDMIIPGIEETFNELMSVKHILEEMSERAPLDNTESELKFMPLTTENVRSVRDYYKDAYSSKDGRRSRMSNTDRTESDLDIYSEILGDGSSDDNMYADDEDDDDDIDTYATADDEFGATGGNVSDSPYQHRQHHDISHDDDEYDEDIPNFVVGCTFYNSKVFPMTTDSLEGASASNVDMPTDKGAASPLKSVLFSTPVNDAPSRPSDEDFVKSNSAIEASYIQMESSADGMSSTFQNAREQMIDIQQHLQALRRQMEDFQDDTQ